MEMTFKRYEYKYFISRKQYEELSYLLKEYMEKDQYSNHTISNIYYDTDDFLLIRRSIEKPVYKEKLRLRSYGTIEDKDFVFLELKKKFESVVYKRRITLTNQHASDFMEGKKELVDSQISKEIAYFQSLYPGLRAKMYISYDREAFYDKKDQTFRITFDQNILWRTQDLSLQSKQYGSPVLDCDIILMEVKVVHAIPLWLTRFLSTHQIFKTTFSKYGTAYKILTQLEKKEGNNAA